MKLICLAPLDSMHSAEALEDTLFNLVGDIAYRAAATREGVVATRKVDLGRKKGRS